MADKALSDLTQGTTDTGDLLYGVIGGNSRKFPIGAVRDAVKASDAEATAGTNTIHFVNPAQMASKTSGPASATDNAITRFSGTTGKEVKNSHVTMDDTGNIVGVGYQELVEVAAPSNPAANKVRMYVADTGSESHVFAVDSAGTRRDLSAATFWFRDNTGLASVMNLLNESSAQDSNGTIDVDTLYPGVVPTDAQALILTIETGYSTTPAGGNGAVSLRVMPAGYNLSSVLDRAKVQQVIANSTAIDVNAQHVLMPIHPSRRTFFWARQSTDTGTANKMSIIDLWGYVR